MLQQVSTGADVYEEDEEDEMDNSLPVSRGAEGRHDCGPTESVSSRQPKPKRSKQEDLLAAFQSSQEK